MKIYTRSGDDGRTHLRGEGGVLKSDPRVEVVGELDELNAFLGLVRSHLNGDVRALLDVQLQKVQETLFEIGAEVSDSEGRRRVEQSSVSVLEEAIDQLSGSLAPLRHFILPGGHPTASLFHVARTVARRAERRLVQLSQNSAVNPASLAYLNRLSDFLFVAARWVNAKGGIPDSPWLGGAP
mgnify:CR=1 FL=1